MHDPAGGRKQSPGAHEPYPEVVAQPRYSALEEQTLSFWRENRTFEASVQLHPPQTEFVFYDGPPFANGLPHYGHLLTGFVKDAVPRYQTMRGRRVERRFGWDCHGLPAEMEAEQELGVSGQKAVTEYGIDRFNAACRGIVQRTTDAWERYVTRQARWVDFENDYRTMDISYMESVLWAFKQLHERGLAYEGYRVLPYCWECETPLSNFETRQDDSYRDRTDPAVTVLFALDQDHGIWSTAYPGLPSWSPIAVTSICGGGALKADLIAANSGFVYAIDDAGGGPGFVYSFAVGASSCWSAVDDSVRMMSISANPQLDAENALLGTDGSNGLWYLCNGNTP